VLSPPRDRPSASRSFGLPGFVPPAGGSLSSGAAPRACRGAQHGHRQAPGRDVLRRLVPRPGGVLVRPDDRRVRRHRPRLTLRRIASGPQSVQDLSHVPSPDQRRCRLYTVFQFPDRSGRSRHGQSARVWWKIPPVTSR